MLFEFPSKHIYDQSQEPPQAEDIPTPCSTVTWAGLTAAPPLARGSRARERAAAAGHRARLAATHSAAGPEGERPCVIGQGGNQ
jgi:hypothetical protein